MTNAPPPKPPPPSVRPSGRTLVPPLLPVLLPLVVAAIILGALFAWLLAPAPPGGAAPAARFTDVTAASGIRFARLAGAGGEPAPTTLGGAVACFDYDADGDEDLFFVNGAPWPWEESLAKRVSRNWPALLRNDGTGHFADATGEAGLNVELQGMAAVAGDYDNDGFPDLFVTCVGANHLFRNRGNGTFEDVTDAAGVGGEDNTWSTGAVWIDFDHDGRLDLVVCHYARWPREVELRLAFAIAKLGRSYGAPTGFVGGFPSAYRNSGDGRFALLPGAAGLRTIDPLTGLPAAKALAVVPLDANDDGRLDLLFAFHTSEAMLFLGDGGGFRRWTGSLGDRREGLSAGIASPFAQALRQDERLPAWRAAAEPAGAGGAPAALALRGRFGIAFLDYDRDGRLDFVSGEGRAESDVGLVEGTGDLRAAAALFWNSGGAWRPAKLAVGENATAPAVVARGVATADFDGDGDLDLVVAQAEGAPLLLRNEQRADIPWLQIDLVASHGAREAGGARVEVHTPRHVFAQTMAPATGFMAQSASTLTFGLGDDARVRAVVVYWPGGRRQEIRAPALNRRLVITEP